MHLVGRQTVAAVAAAVAAAAAVVAEVAAAAAAAGAAIMQAAVTLSHDDVSHPMFYSFLRDLRTLYDVVRASRSTNFLLRVGMLVVCARVRDFYTSPPPTSGLMGVRTCVSTATAFFPLDT